MKARLAVLTLSLCTLFATGSASAATFNVSNTNPSGPGSLRDAVQQANAAAGSTINLPAGTYPIAGNGDDTNVTGDFDITASTTINGAGSGQTTIDAGANDRIFDIFNATTSVSLTGMTLTSGNNTQGSAIRHDGSGLGLADVTLTGNNAGGGGVPGSGTIYWTPTLDVSLNVASSTITNNHVGGGGAGGFGSGGVLYLSSVVKHTVAVSNSAITNNSAGGGGASGSGGAFYMSPGAAGEALTLTKTTMNSNSAGGGGAGGNGSGGGVYLSSTGPHTVSLDGSSISNNRAGGGGASGSGGGIYNSPGVGGGTLTLANATIDGNSTGGGGANGSGGGVYFSSSGPHTLSLDGSSISNNRAGGDGASGSGGGIYNSPGGGGGTLTLANTTIDGNSTGGGGVNGSGGGVYFSSSGPHTLSLDGSSISNNRAGGDGASGSGGGIYNSPGATGGELRLTNTKMDGNAAGGGATGVGGGMYYSFGDDQPATIDRSSISNNATGGGGATNASGGGLYYSPGSASSALTIVNSTLSGNSTTGTAAVFGGGLELSSGTIQITNATIAGNAANGGPGNGGGIYLSGAPTTLKNTILSGNTATNGNNCFGGGTTSLGHNLESADTCSFNATGDLKNTNPQLGPFADYGGPTKTHNLIKGSPAINAGDNNGCPATDQRGGARPQPTGGTCDIGAYEYGALADLVASGTVKPDPADAGHDLTYTIKVTNGGPSPDDAAGIKLSDALPAETDVSSAKASQGSCSGKAPVVCSIGTLAKGASATVTLVVKPKHAVVGTNVATASGDPTDSNPGDNVSRITTNIRVGLDGLSLRPKSFKAVSASASIARRRGGTVRYKLSDNSKVNFTVEKRTRGRKLKGQKCGAKSKKNRKGKRCVFYKRVKGSSFTRSSKAGKNRFKFTGRVRRKRLKPGRYRLVAFAKGKTKALDSAAKRTSFKIVRR